MPYAKRLCSECQQPFQPFSGRPTCPGCNQARKEAARIELPSPAEREAAVATPRPLESRRWCEVCQKAFVPPGYDPGVKRCPECRRIAERALVNDYDSYQPGGPLPQTVNHIGAPLRQGVFDLETFDLNRGWGVLMVGSVLVFGGREPEQYTFDLRQGESWKKGIRSNDAELGALILKVLSSCHVLYAHNGARFDIPYLNAVALKYGMPRLTQKLIDPVQIARRKYRIGSNSLSSLASFLDLPEEKMPVAADTWRKALFDADEASWQILRERCESDVRLLAMVAGRISDDVGIIDTLGSFRG